MILKDGAIVHHCNLEEERRLNRSFVELEVTGDDRNLRMALPEIGAEGVSEGGGRWRIVLPAGAEVEAIWGLAARQNLLVRKLTHRRDTLEEIFLKAMGHLAHTPGDGAPGSDPGGPVDRGQTPGLIQDSCLDPWGQTPVRTNSPIHRF